MSDRKVKRFWKRTAIVPVGDGFGVELDGRRLKTPGKADLTLPSMAMAEDMAAEWDAQKDQVDPASMPVTRMANSAIDKVGPQHREVAEMLAGYGDADLLCYRAESPAELVARQADAWDPPLDWAEAELGVRLYARVGVMHVAQPEAALARLSDMVHRQSAFQLSAFHDLVSLTGSLILGFAATRGWRDADEIWRLSRLDEIWQEERWGVDDTAAAAADKRRSAFLDARRFFENS
jgi:chaperone required for assembly of F1-ATPase